MVPAPPGRGKAGVAGVRPSRPGGRSRQCPGRPVRLRPSQALLGRGGSPAGARSSTTETVKPDAAPAF